MPSEVNPTIDKNKLKRLAGETPSEDLLNALADFENLSEASPRVADYLDQIRAFRKKFPRFFPEDVYDVAEDRSGVWPGLEEGKGHTYFRCYQRWLRALWRGDSRFGTESEILDILLGLQIDDLAGLRSIGRDSWLPRAKPLANWKTGMFDYQPACDFQRAVHLLFKQSWRAMVCGRCDKSFVADHPKQVYCGTACSNKAKLLRSKTWWERHGREWRNRRAQKSHVRKSQQRRGK